MKKLITLFALFIGFVSFSQTGYKSTRNNGVNMTTEDYVINSPGNTPSTSATTARYKDSTYIQWLFANAYFANLPNTVNNGNPVNFLHTGSDGRVLSSSISWLAPDSNNIFTTKYYLAQNVFTKAQSDMRYLQSFAIDSTMIANAVGNNAWSLILNKSYHVLIDTPNLGLYRLKNDTVNIATQYRLDTGKANIRTQIPTNNNQLTNGSGYLTSYTETDPLFDTKFAGKTTTGLAEGTNLYYTIARFNSAFSSSLTSAAISTALGGAAMKLSDTTSLSNRINTKLTIPTGTSIQYLNGVGTPTSFSVAKRIESYSGTTNASGVYAVSYGTVYAVTPNVQFQINGGTNKQTILLTASSTTGFSIYVQLRADVLGLLPTYSNVSGQALDVMVFEK